MTITRVLDAAGRPSRYVAIFNDITDLHRKDEQIEHQAYHDALTGLPNRLLLSKRLAQALALARRNDHGVALLFIDLDRFKTSTTRSATTSATSSCEVGAAAAVLRLRESDTVARLGGDEFIVVLGEAARPRALPHVAQKHPEAPRGSRSPIRGGSSPPASASPVSRRRRRRRDAAQACRHGDVPRPRPRPQHHQFFTADMTHKTHAAAELENDLRRALANDELRLHYQPDARLTDGEIVGVEALLRWHHPSWAWCRRTSSSRSPRRSGLILPIGEWVLRTACREAVGLACAQGCRCTVSVNLSARQFRDGPARARSPASSRRPASSRVARARGDRDARHDRADASSRCCTAQAPGHRARRSTISAPAIRRSATSSSFPIDTLKIDRCFIQHCGHDGNSATVVSAIINLAAQLGHSVVAEGVETVAQLSFLRERKCSMIQGYLLGRPVPLADFTAQLGRWRKIVAALASPIA